MTLSEKILNLSRQLPPEEQNEVLDFIEFLISKRRSRLWTLSERKAAIIQTCGILKHTKTSADLFAQRKVEEKRLEERRWKS
ncbi:MAG: DUF2281 domain-containing protein [bacterium]